MLTPSGATLDSQATRERGAKMAHANWAFRQVFGERDATEEPADGARVPPRRRRAPHGLESEPCTHGASCRLRESLARPPLGPLMCAACVRVRRGSDQCGPI